MKRGYLWIALCLLCTAAVAERELKQPAAKQGLDVTSFTGEKVERIRFSRLQGWESIDEQSLVLWTNNREAWLLTLTGRCIDLDFEFQIAVSSFGQTIDAGFDSILVNKQRCRIRTIHKVDLSAFRKAKAPYDASALQPSEAVDLRQADLVEREKDQKSAD